MWENIYIYIVTLFPKYVKLALVFSHSIFNKFELDS